ncbi:MAG: hypothetical protein HKN51_15815 [Saprospiraceae bacterium]|nr:hypothetical protein [Bacteroidia bacterium]NNE16448.1 hypothetical protein [Saprospiraceae bacterium]
MIKYAFSILGLLACSSLLQCQSKLAQADLNQVTQSKITEIENYRGIKILDEGPTGSKHTNSKRGEFGCSKFRITVYNDTILPIELEIKFPSQPTTSLPDPAFNNQYWVLPDSLTPDTFQNAWNFGIIGLEEHFNSDFTDSPIVKRTIQPKEYYTFYLAGIGETTFGSGQNYSKLFINGQKIDVPYLQGKSIKDENTESDSLNLVWGIGHSPHNLYTLIPCGQISYLEH